MAKQWTKVEIENLTKDLGANEEPVECGGAFDIAEGILSTEHGLKESIERIYNVTDAQGWLADRI